MPPLIQMTTNPSVLVGSTSHGFYRIDIERKTFDLIGEVEENLSYKRFNGGECDSLGRYWAGTMNFDFVSPIGSLYTLELDKSIKQKVKVARNIERASLV